MAADFSVTSGPGNRIVKLTLPPTPDWRFFGSLTLGGGKHVIKEPGERPTSLGLLGRKGYGSTGVLK
jgi:hypothetical protein